MDTRSRITALVLLSLGVTACPSGIEGTPVEAAELCGETARTICAADASCFPDSSPEDCALTQLDACTDCVGPRRSPARQAPRSSSRA